MVGNSQIAVIDVATRQRQNVSVNGFADHTPRFGQDGIMLPWESDRHSMRQLDDQTATGDVVGASPLREAAADYAIGGRAGL
jgi:hypothetical protein